MLGEIVARIDGRDLVRHAAGPDPRPAGDAAHHRRLDRPRCRRLLRAAIHRRPGRASRSWIAAMARAAGWPAPARHGALGVVPRRPGRRGAAPDTVEEMCQPQIVIDRERWKAAQGLGFFLVRSGDRTCVGHTGGMPGHITRCSPTGRPRRRVALTNSGTAPPSPASRSPSPTGSPRSSRWLPSRGVRAPAVPGGAGRAGRRVVVGGQRVQVLGPAGPARGPGSRRSRTTSHRPGSRRSGARVPDRVGRGGSCSDGRDDSDGS